MNTWQLILVLLALVLFHCYKARDPLARLAVYVRWFFVILMATAGLGKLTVHSSQPWFSVMGPVFLEDQLNAHGLGLFARFIAWSQIGIALLLASKRFSTLGAIALVPMLSCILMVTVALQWTGTPYVVVGLLLMNAFLLFQSRAQLLNIIGLPSPFVVPRGDRLPSGSDILWALGSVLILTLGKYAGICGFALLLLAEFGPLLLRVKVRTAVPW